jgi:hypothetical protein
MLRLLPVLLFPVLASCALKTGGLGSSGEQDTTTEDGDFADLAVDAPGDAAEEPALDTPADSPADLPVDAAEDLPHEPAPDTPADPPVDTTGDFPEETKPDTPDDSPADLPEDEFEDALEDPILEPTPACGPEGALLWDICWYLGDPGQSCQEVCESRGGYHEDTPQYVGTTGQGGSIEECNAIFDALGYLSTVNEGYRGDGLGLGCHRWNDGVLWWLESPDFDPGDGTGGAQLVCGCNA